jgi:succinate dehydrogenase / fumarate reductase, cytochrome b subunit
MKLPEERFARKKIPNKLGLWGWISGGRYGLDRYAYSLHRITGLAILAYFLMHIFVTGSRLGGPEQWENTMALFKKPVFKAGEFLLFLAFVFHALNGIRLVIVELGYSIGKPSLPEYPYVHSALRQKSLFIAVMLIAAAVMIFGGANLFLVIR